jgi:lipopolysaccharide/colanic/teichoic acid biosynthesis glycosyltransferase
MVVGADKMKDQLLEQNESGAGVIFKMKKDPRVTNTGRFIRRFSIDELPQLLNVLKGDMSLVGPRPPIPREVAEYSLQDRSRLQTLPGITCIWQVSGRSDIPFDEQVVLDRDYIRERKGISYDIKLLFMTVWAVASGNGAY